MSEQNNFPNMQAFSKDIFGEYGPDTISYWFIQKFNALANDPDEKVRTDLFNKIYANNGKATLDFCLDEIRVRKTALSNSDSFKRAHTDAGKPEPVINDNIKFPLMSDIQGANASIIFRKSKVAIESKLKRYKGHAENLIKPAKPPVAPQRQPRMTPKGASQNIPVAAPVAPTSSNINAEPSTDPSLPALKQKKGLPVKRTALVGLLTASMLVPASRNAIEKVFPVVANVPFPSLNKTKLDKLRETAPEDTTGKLLPPSQQK